jgi:hypothetical protein
MSESELIVCIKDDASLAQARVYLYDALLSSNCISHDKIKQEIRLSFWQPDFTQCHFKQLWLFFWSRVVPMRRWEMIIKRVSAVNVNLGGEPATARDRSVGDLVFAKYTVHIETHDQMTISVGVQSLDALLYRTLELDFSRALKSLVIRCPERRKGARDFPGIPAGDSVPGISGDSGTGTRTDIDTLGRFRT